MDIFDFDLEDAQVELERVNNLLGIFNEFCDECPTEDTSKMPTVNAVLFCARFRRYADLIFSAQDKIFQLVKQMDTAVKSYYEAKKGGAA